MKIRLASAVIALLLSLPGSATYAQFGVTGSNSGQAAGWLAGVQAGHNWQSGAFVYGIETDLSGIALKTSFNTFPNAFPPTTINTSSNIAWYGTLRGRFVWSAGQWLFFGTGGLAYGGFHLASTVTIQGNGTNALQVQDSGIGWVGGGGIAYKYSPHLVFTLNYQYVDLGTVSYASTVFLSTQTASEHARFQVVTFGVSWLFGPDGSNGMWVGNYVGGHAGGGSGNNTRVTYGVEPPL